MSALMNLPQWFLERDDSDYLFKELFLNSPNVVEYFEFCSKERYIFCYNDFAEVVQTGLGPKIMRIDALRDLEEIDEYSPLSIAPVFLYDTKNDIFKEVKLEVK